MDYIEGIKRYFLVIRELHEMGYELIRACPCLSPSGLLWRCATTVKKYTLKNCGAIYHGPAHTAADTHSGQFKWGDCEGLTPYEIANQFIEHYPHIAEWGKGNDAEYKEWFKKASDLAQRGYIFYAFGDGISCFNNNHRMLLNINPPTGEYLPFPPAGELEININQQ
ncbi:MAG: hypothetical protein IJ911_10575 [Salinivirgaceae bacterium]|nr:hypothetical protein [Salinivirgaceae bacterium]